MRRNGEMSMHDREAKDLPVHVAACHERYLSLFNRLGSVERKLSRIELGIWGVLTAVLSGLFVAIFRQGLGL